MVTARKPYRGYFVPICADGRPFGTGRAVLFMDGLGLSRVEGHRRHLLFGLCVSEGVKQAVPTLLEIGSRQDRRSHSQLGFRAQGVKSMKQNRLFV